MRPAFSSPFQAGSFALLLVVILTGPLWMQKGLLPPRREAYLSGAWQWAPFPWLGHEMFDETNDIDIAFVGSSHLFWGVDTPYVEKEADQVLGRQSVVRTFGWGGPGFDALYYFSKDLLTHRKVRMLVFYDETEPYPRNGATPVWFRWGDEPRALDGLPLGEKIPYYFAAIVGLPRNLIAWLRPGIPPDLELTNSFQIRYLTENLARHLGSVSMKIAFHTGQDDTPPLIPFTPKTGALAGDFCAYSPATRARFEFSHLPLSPWQKRFAEKFGPLAQEHGCKLVMVQIPILSEAGQSAIEEAQFWPDVLHAPVTMLGIPPAKLFAGLSEEEIKLLFYDRNHFNQNGQRYFTSLLTPALLKIYEQDVQH